MSLIHSGQLIWLVVYGYNYTVRFIAPIFCIDATLLCEFESDTIRIKSLNRIAADKSHRVIVAYIYITMPLFIQKDVVFLSDEIHFGVIMHNKTFCHDDFLLNLNTRALIAIHRQCCNNTAWYLNRFRGSTSLSLVSI